jgi:hypothetical protein
MGEIKSVAHRSVLDRLREGTLAHAVLLTGPRGVGKGDFARWIAAASVCTGEKPPCGVCDACVSFASLADLDLLVLRPIDRPVWVERERLEGFFPDGVGKALGQAQGEGFLLDPLPDPANRMRLPLRLDPSALFRRGRGSARFDRGALETRISGSSIGGGGKAFLREVTRAGLSVEWYLSTIGIGLMTGAEDASGAAGRAGVIPFLGRRPAARRRKVVILEEADRMTEEAQNALLKTLEEPPPDSLLLLTSPRREALLDTIRSRCEHMRVPLPSPEERRREGPLYFADMEGAEWEDLLLLGEGVPAQAAEIDPDAYRRERDEAEALLGAAETSPFGAYFTRLEAWAEEADEGEEGGVAALLRLSVFMLLAREKGIEAARMGEEGAGASARAERLFASAHRALVAARPGANVRLLLEEFGMDVWKAAGRGPGGAR